MRLESVCRFVYITTRNLDPQKKYVGLAIASSAMSNYARTMRAALMIEAQR